MLTRSAPPPLFQNLVAPAQGPQHIHRGGGQHKIPPSSLPTFPVPSLIQLGGSPSPDYAKMLAPVSCPSVAPFLLAPDQLAGRRCQIAHLYVSSRRKDIASVLQMRSLSCRKVAARPPKPQHPDPIALVDPHHLRRRRALIPIPTQCDPRVSVLTTAPPRFPRWRAK